ncbi:nickel ABC transporter permease [Alkalibacter mobilis]|uniref:nickel ABC transporter permease n=1 Tax=Alkalibacter mobilis TaxID=2787712 RepID=UPI00189D3A81|nr:nickel ABC transporter permease [Alkalibacter mobilis]MBF7096793.1 ABC transporter permease [Alkalibacter mobilis]
MKKYILTRMVHLLIVMFVVSFFTFAMVYIAPGDPAELLLSAHDTIPTSEVLEKTRTEMGLDDSFIIQFGRWLKGVLHGDLGTSYVSGEAVWDRVIPRLGMSIKLAVTAFILLVGISFPLGFLSAVFKSKPVDHTIRIISFLEISVPTFWLGLILIYTFTVKFQWFKIMDQQSVKSVVLPAFTLAVPLIGRYTRIIRAAILDEYSKNYVLGERSRGAGELSILLRNVLPNSILGILTLLGLSVALLLGGTVIVENIFSWQGLGSLALQSVTYRDYPVLQSYVLLMSIIYVNVNFVVDVVTIILDPRLREEN